MQAQVLEIHMERLLKQNDLMEMALYKCGWSCHSDSLHQAGTLVSMIRWLDF